MSLIKIKNNITNNLKNIYGWKTDRKIVVFSVDDYGNVRVDSKEARDQMNKQGLKIMNRFDALDTLETREDLEASYEVLSSVKDKTGRHAVFTPFALSCNIDFEKMADEGYENYYYELLSDTFKKLSEKYPKAYSGAYDLIMEGIKEEIFLPQFHGREHLNLKVFEEKLKKRDHELMTALENRSFTSISMSGYSTISTAAAFDFWEFEENEKFDKIIREGLTAFKKVYGYSSNHFNAPAGREHPIIHNTLNKCGVEYIDTPFIKKEHQGKGKYKTIINYTGKQNRLGQTFLVRNVVFEPTEKRNIDWVPYTLKQIEAAFRWKRPAIISSHRVNFCGFIEEKNRLKGLEAVRKLLHEIVKRWPEVEFMAANELGDLVVGDKK
ncbi:hypothetical protein [Rhodohalobacter sp.]|uniref:hypothetical protein n=1 Tax=Rhodohalobacter sp. TaxID=1974210 RepID=UPI002ACD8592|nr:hypothetical protein [Rhodohalobacter sp.]MDZ7755209.1 hypothetical protein [Rhodohalobacter sp.]